MTPNSWTHLLGALGLMVCAGCYLNLFRLFRIIVTYRKIYPGDISFKGMLGLTAILSICTAAVSFLMLRAVLY